MPISVRHRAVIPAKKALVTGRPAASITLSAGVYVRSSAMRLITPSDIRMSCVTSEEEPRSIKLALVISRDSAEMIPELSNRTTDRNKFLMVSLT